MNNQELTLECLIGKIEAERRFRPKVSLFYMQKAFSLLNLNLDDVYKIHITGTNGKGSTSHYISSMLSLVEGNKVGLFTSPYLVRFNERIKINNEEISDALLKDVLAYILDFQERFCSLYDERLSFFELITLAALKVFSDEGCNYIVMEVGIGGLHDSTNILNYDISIITTIGFDHMKQLGNTLEEISTNKLGIVKKGNTLFTTVDESLWPLFQDYCNKVEAKVFFIARNSVEIRDNNKFVYQGLLYQTPLLGSYQVYNAVLAINAINYIYKNTDNYELAKKGLSITELPGRLQRIGDNLYIDGAHNIHAIKTLIDDIPYLFKNASVGLVFSALADKDIMSMISYIIKNGYECVMTGFEDDRYRPLNTIVPDVLFMENFEEAISYMRKRAEVVICLGSLHFVGQILKKHS